MFDRLHSATTFLLQLALYWLSGLLRWEQSQCVRPEVWEDSLNHGLGHSLLQPVYALRHTALRHTTGCYLSDSGGTRRPVWTAGTGQITRTHLGDYSHLNYPTWR